METNRRIMIDAIDLLKRQQLTSKEVQLVTALEAMQAEIEDLKQEIKDK